MKEPIPQDVLDVWNRHNEVAKFKEGEVLGAPIFPWPPSWKDVSTLIHYISKLREAHP